MIFCLRVFTNSFIGGAIIITSWLILEDNLPKTRGDVLNRIRNEAPIAKRDYHR